MPLFVDPKARVRLTFGDDCPIEELRGEWIDVRESIGDAQWQELQAGALTAAATGDAGDWHMAFSGENGLRRMAYWIEAVSFVDGAGRPYPAQNTGDRMRWLGAMWPPAANEVRALLDVHVQGAWSTAQAVPHPKAEPSSDQDQTGS